MASFERLDTFLNYCDTFGTPAEKRGARSLRTILRHRDAGNLRGMTAARKRIYLSCGVGSWAAEHAAGICFDYEMSRVWERAAVRSR